LNSWEALKQYLIEKGYTEPEMLTAGLIVEGEAGQDTTAYRGIVTVDDYLGHIRKDVEVSPPPEADAARFRSSVEEVGGVPLPCDAPSATGSIAIRPAISGAISTSSASTKPEAIHPSSVGASPTRASRRLSLPNCCRQHTQC
jgi:hypothetical protein